MFTEVNQPKKIQRKELDDYLAKAWFRMGQSIFTCHFLFFQSQLYSSIWIRLALKDYTYSKSLRKIIRINKPFQTIIRKAIFDEEKDELYRIHRKRFAGYVAGSLKDSLMEGKDKNIYETYEICVYDGDRLAAASFFDLGKKSAASIMGLFHPDYHKYSLGIYTMLMEINFCMEQKMDFYYPGYVVPGYSSFDYKLRIGKTDYYCPYDHIWKPYSGLDHSTLPSVVLEEGLKKAQTIFAEHDIATSLTAYPMYDKLVYGYKPKEFVRTPMILFFDSEESYRHELILAYNIFKKTYELKVVIRFMEGSGYALKLFDKYDKDNTCFDLLFIAGFLADTASMSNIIEIVKASQYGEDD